MGARQAVRKVMRKAANADEHAWSVDRSHEGVQSECSRRTHLVRWCRELAGCRGIGARRSHPPRGSGWSWLYCGKRVRDQARTEPTVFL